MYRVALFHRLSNKIRIQVLTVFNFGSESMSRESSHGCWVLGAAGRKAGNRHGLDHEGSCCQAPIWVPQGL